MSASPVRRSTRTVAACCAALVWLAGCSIQPATAPTDVPEDQRGAFGADVATGDEAAGSSQIFLLAPPEPNGARQLRSVLRDVPGTPAAVLRSLLSGPNATEQDDLLDTALPQELEIASVRTLGRVSTIDVNEALDALDPVELRLAIAQLVITATNLADVDAVVIRVAGENRVWPRGDGELTDQPLTAFDYPGVVESTQPPYPAFSPEPG